MKIILDEKDIKIYKKRWLRWIKNYLNNLTLNDYEEIINNGELNITIKCNVITFSSIVKGDDDES